MGGKKKEEHSHLEKARSQKWLNSNQNPDKKNSKSNFGPRTKPLRDAKGRIVKKDSPHAVLRKCYTVKLAGLEKKLQTLQNKLIAQQNNAMNDLVLRQAINNNLVSTTTELKSAVGKAENSVRKTQRQSLLHQSYTEKCISLENKIQSIQNELTAQQNNTMHDLDLHQTIDNKLVPGSVGSTSELASAAAKANNSTKKAQYDRQLLESERIFLSGQLQVSSNKQEKITDTVPTTKESIQRIAAVEERQQLSHAAAAEVLITLITHGSVRQNPR